MRDTHARGTKKARKTPGRDGGFSAALLDAVAALVVILDAKGRVVRFNRACERSSGYLSSEVEGRQFWEGLPPEEVERVRSVFERLGAGESLVEDEHRWVARDGTQHWIAWSNTAMRADDGELEFIVATGTDITGRRQTEAEGERQLAEMDAVYAAISDAVVVYDAHGTPIRANPAATAAFGVNLVGADRARLAEKLVTRHPDGRLFTVDELPVGRALHGERVTDERVVLRTADGRELTILENAAPLLTNGAVSGAVAVWHDVTGQTQAESALRESEEKLRTLFEIVPFGVAVLDRNRNIINANPALSRIFDLSKRELLDGRYIERAYLQADGKLMNPEDWASNRAFSEQRLIEDVETGVVKAGGEVVWASVSAAPLPFPDWRVIVASIDITARKQAEQALLRERDFAAAVLDTSGGQVIVLDRLGRIVRYNRAGERATGYKFEEVQGKPFWELFLEPEEVESARKAFSERQAGDIPTTYEGNWVAKDGSKRWIVWSITALADERGMAEYVIGSGADLTDRRRMEEERARMLQESQRREAELAALLDGARQILARDSLQESAQSIIKASQDLSGAAEGYVVFAPRFRADTGGILLVRGVGAEWVDPDLSRPIQALHDEVYRTGRAVRENAFRSSPWVQTTPNDPAGAENLLVTPVVLAREVVGLLGMANKPGGFDADDARVGTAFAELVAIALHKSQLQESIRASERRFRSVTETASAAIVGADDQGRITFWNRMAERVFGYSAQEATGSPLTLIMPERFWPAHQAAMRRVVDTGKSRLAGETFELIGIRKDGTEFPIEMSLATWKTVEGSFFTAVLQDITKRKDAELALHEALQSFETLFKSSPLAIVAHGIDSSVRLWNPTAEEMFGWSEAEVLGRPNPIVPADRQAEYQNMIAQAREGKPLSFLETTRMRKDGSLVDVNVWSALLYDTEGRIRDVMAILADVGERKRADEKLRQYARQQASLIGVAAAVSATLDRDELLPIVLDAVVRALGGDAAWILMPYPSPTDPPRVVAHRGTSKEQWTSESIVPVEDCPLFRPLSEGNVPAEPKLVVDCPALAATVSHESAQPNLVCVPLYAGNRLQGVLKINWQEPRPNSERDREFLLSIGRQVGVALHNAQLFQQARQLDRLQALSDLDRALAATFDLRKLAEETMQGVRTYLNVPAAAIFLLPPAGEMRPLQEMFTSAGSWEEVKIADRDLVRWQAFLGRLSNEPEPVDFGPEEFGLASHDSELVRQWQRDAIVVPIRGEHSFMALLALGGRGPDRPLTEEDRALAAVAASHAGQAMQNAELYNELRGLLAEREQTRAQLLQSEKLAALGRLAASIAHEINNPLQAIENSLTLVHDEIEGSQRRDKLERYLGIVGGEVGRISGIVRQMRDYYRPAHERLQPTDVRVVLDSVFELSGKELQHHNVTVERLDAPSLPQIQANSAHLKQVFLNLVLNAIEAMPDGGVLRVRTSLDQIRPADAERPQTVIRVDVSDTGGGMSAEAVAHLFEPFFTTKPQGAGLGLYVSYSIIEAHHGQILVSSELGAGTTFTILLPVTSP